MRLQLHVFAYNLGNFMLAGDAEDGAAVVADQPAREAHQDRREGRQPRALRHVAEVAVSRQMFANILSLIARLRTPPAPA